MERTPQLYDRGFSVFLVYVLVVFFLCGLCFCFEQKCRFFCFEQEHRFSGVALRPTRFSGVLECVVFM